MARKTRKNKNAIVESSSTSIYNTKTSQAKDILYQGAAARAQSIGEGIGKKELSKGFKQNWVADASHTDAKYKKKKRQKEITPEQTKKNGRLVSRASREEMDSDSSFLV